MASPAGIEPATYALGGRRAIRLCHGDVRRQIIPAAAFRSSIHISTVRYWFASLHNSHLFFIITPAFFRCDQHTKNPSKMTDSAAIFPLFFRRQNLFKMGLTDVEGEGIFRRNRPGS